jgi:hypothetical protein
VAGCPEERVAGSYSCWRRDEFTLDLWVRAPTCAAPLVDGQPPVDGRPVQGEPEAAACPGATVSIKVRNGIADERARPGTTPDPGLVGETPDATLSVDPLDEATPSPS